MTCALRISLFGGIRISRDEPGELIHLPHASEALLAYLVLFRQRTHSRDVLLGQFWGDHSEERARNCLNTALWRLRRILEIPETTCQGPSIITATNGEVGIRLEPESWVDVAEFDDKVVCILDRQPEAVTLQVISELEQALKTYTGDLLEGYYEDWVLRERERYQILFLNGLAYLMEFYRARADYPKSLLYGQKILEHDPLREEIHRQVMRLYLASGQRANAIRQYELCRLSLLNELGIEPMEETQSLYRSIFEGNVPDAGLSLVHAGYGLTGDLQTTLVQLRRALEDCENMARGLRTAIEAIEHQIVVQPVGMPALNGNGRGVRTQ